MSQKFLKSLVFSFFFSLYFTPCVFCWFWKSNTKSNKFMINESYDNLPSRRSENGASTTISDVFSTVSELSSAESDNSLASTLLPKITSTTTTLQPIVSTTQSSYPTWSEAKNSEGTTTSTTTQSSEPTSSEPINTELAQTSTTQSSEPMSSEPRNAPNDTLRTTQLPNFAENPIPNIQSFHGKRENDGNEPSDNGADSVNNPGHSTNDAHQKQGTTPASGNENANFTVSTVKGSNESHDPDHSDEETNNGDSREYPELESSRTTDGKGIRNVLDEDHEDPGVNEVDYSVNKTVTSNVTSSEVMVTTKGMTEPTPNVTTPETKFGSVVKSSANLITLHQSIISLFLFASTIIV